MVKTIPLLDLLLCVVVGGGGGGVCFLIKDCRSNNVACTALEPKKTVQKIFWHSPIKVLNGKESMFFNIEFIIAKFSSVFST